MAQPALQPPVFDLTAELFEKITSIVNSETGIQFPPEKRTLVQARISKRLRTLKIAGFAEYAEFLNSKEGEVERKSLVSLLTTNVTRFFRENHHFDHLKTEVLPGLIERARNGGRVRLTTGRNSSPPPRICASC